MLLRYLGPIQATTTPPLVPYSPGPCAAANAGLPGHKQPGGFPKMLSEGTHELDASAHHLLLVLKKLDPSVCSAQAVARSYDAYGWEGVMPVPWNGLQTDCKAKSCTVTVPAGVQYRIDAFAQTDNPTADESASRFLSQTSFGATRKDIRSFLKSSNANSVIEPMDNTLFKAWLDDQTALPATLLRKYWRERTNQRVAVDSQAGSTIQPCEKMSRWHRCVSTAASM